MGLRHQLSFSQPGGIAITSNWKSPHHLLFLQPCTIRLRENIITCSNDIYYDDDHKPSEVTLVMLIVVGKSLGQ